MKPVWIIMPVIDCLEMTQVALQDCLTQSVPTRVLVINNGSSEETRRALEQIAEFESRLLVWSHVPPLPSLSATWNAGLDFVWQQGGERALVVNNDVRLRLDTVEWLTKIMDWEKAHFVTCVGVREEQFDPSEGLIFPDDPDAAHPKLAKGGPDFSCFLISRTCHLTGRFDEAFIPAYCEDLDYHRRMMLAGHGDKIFSVNLPFLHYASQTSKQFTPEQRAKWAKRAEQSRAHYRAKWGGDVNKETFWTAFGKEPEESTHKDALILAGIPGPTTPELQEWYRQRELKKGEAVAKGLPPAPDVPTILD